jgi:hypothetical protein
MNVTQGDTFTDPDATATDDTDGSVTVSATGSVDTSTVGTYTITYTARDSAGNSASEIRTVNVAAAPIVEETPICIAGDAALEGILKDSTTGVALANVEVSVGGCTTTTNEQGFYTLQNIAVNERAVVNFKKEGYLLGSTHIQIKTDSSNYLEYGMHAHDHQWNYDSTEEIFGSHIAVDASAAYIDTEGKPYSGIITANLTILDTTTNEGKELFPGAFKGINTNGTMIQFDSYGLITIYLNDSNGNRLNLADGETATLGFDAVSSLEEQSTIPLWYYDYEQGLWFEEGYAELQADGTYRGDISHLGTWSLNRPIENAPGTYRGRIVFEDGTPAKDVRIYAIGANWIGTDLSTDSDGTFEIEVIPDSNFQLKAYNYKDKYEAVYAGTIQAITSGEIVEDRI